MRCTQTRYFKVLYGNGGRVHPIFPQFFPKNYLYGISGGWTIPLSHNILYNAFRCIYLHSFTWYCVWVCVLALMLLCVRFRMKVMLVECYRKYASNSFAAMFRHPWTLNHPTNQPTNRKKNSKQCAHGIFKSECSLSYLYMQIDR